MQLIDYAMAAVCAATGLLALALVFYVVVGPGMRTSGDEVTQQIAALREDVSTWLGMLLFVVASSAARYFWILATQS